MLMTWGLAGLVVALALGALLFSSHRKPKAAPHAIQALDPYAASLTFGDLQMSESAALSAVKVTYIDGNIRNTGQRPSRMRPCRCCSAMMSSYRRR